jgi:hypothetical protein
MRDMWNLEGESRNALMALVEKTEGNGLLSRPKHRWEYSINIGPK